MTNQFNGEFEPNTQIKDALTLNMKKTYMENNNPKVSTQNINDYRYQGEYSGINSFYIRECDKLNEVPGTNITTQFNGEPGQMEYDESNEVPDTNITTQFNGEPVQIEPDNYDFEQDAHNTGLTNQFNGECQQKPENNQEASPPESNPKRKYKKKIKPQTLTLNLVRNQYIPDMPLEPEFLQTCTPPVPDLTSFLTDKFAEIQIQFQASNTLLRQSISISYWKSYRPKFESVL